MKAGVALACMVLVSACASQQDSASAVYGSHNPDELVCRTEKSTGSHTRTRVCRTVREMEEDRRQAQEVMQKRGGTQSSPEG